MLQKGLLVGKKSLEGSEGFSFGTAEAGSPFSVVYWLPGHSGAVFNERAIKGASRSPADFCFAGVCVRSPRCLTTC